MKMSKKKKKVYSIEAKGKKKPLVINQNKLNLQKEYHSVNFKTGGYMTEKDRPRKRYKAKDVDYD